MKSDNGANGKSSKQGHGVFEVVLLLVLLILAVGLWRIWTMGGPLSVQAARTELVPKSALARAKVSSAPLQVALAPDDQRGAYFSELGQTGDAFGGLNALMTAVAGALLAWAGYLQFRSLQRARADAGAADIHRASEQHQQIFFS
ncbi:MAG: hypothetical protein ABIT82_10830 [Ramlibacter sp.]